MAFILVLTAADEISIESFNPPLGIGGLHTLFQARKDNQEWRFQSPTRDRWPSYKTGKVNPILHDIGFNPPLGIGGLHTGNTSMAELSGK